MFVFSNLAMTLDGKIAHSNRKILLLGSSQDRLQMQVLRKECDAVLMGAATLRTYKKPCLVHGALQQPVNIIVSSSLEGISPHWAFFKSTQTKRVLFLNQKIAPKQIKKFENDTTEIVFLKKNKIASQILKYLEKKKINRLLVEGGGELMWVFSSLNLIDEYHVTLTSKILGGRTSPTLVDGKGFEPEKILGLQLEQCRIIKNELFLVYRKKST